VQCIGDSLIWCLVWSDTRHCLGLTQQFSDFYFFVLHVSLSLLSFPSNKHKITSHSGSASDFNLPPSNQSSFINLHNSLSCEGYHFFSNISHTIYFSLFLDSALQNFQYLVLGMNSSVVLGYLPPNFPILNPETTRNHGRRFVGSQEAMIPIAKQTRGAARRIWQVLLIRFISFCIFNLG
jgi:hypothetical protein